MHKIFSRIKSIKQNALPHSVGDITSLGLNSPLKNCQSLLGFFHTQSRRLTEQEKLFDFFFVFSQLYSCTQFEKKLKSHCFYKKNVACSSVSKNFFEDFGKTKYLQSMYLYGTLIVAFIRLRFSS